MAAFIGTARNNGIAIIWFDRPNKRNAFNDQIRAEYLVVLSEFGDDPAVKAVVLTKRGKGFYAGGDIAAMSRACSAFDISSYL